jgi:multicomponent Na+:H+ antiporter subunit D
VIPLAAVLVPLVGSAAVVLSGDRPRLRATWSVAAAAVTLALVVVLYVDVLAGGEPTTSLGSLLPGIELGLRVDAAGALFAFSATGLWLLAVAYSLGYVRGTGEKHQTRFFAIFAICVSTTIGLAFAGDLLTFFIFYEALTLATYPLVVHKQSPEALAAGRKYLLTLLGGGTAVLLAVVIVEANAPGLGFTPGGFLGDALSDAAIVGLVALTILGFGTKAAVMPLHGWLPSAMVAPTPVSALLHAVAVVKAGVFGFVRMIGYVIGPERLAEVGAGVVIAVLAAVTIVVASLIAVRQDNLKRRLAYSTVAHLSYMVLGLSLLSASAWNGAMLHLANHAVLKITLFFCAGAIFVTTGIDRVSKMDGIGRRMPVTMAAFSVAALGLVGLPPVGGFVSKWFLGLGTFEAGDPLLAVIVIGGGLLTAAYLFPVILRAFFRSPQRSEVAASGGRGEASPLMLAPLTITASVGLLLGLGDVFSIGELADVVGSTVTGGSP